MAIIRYESPFRTFLQRFWNEDWGFEPGQRKVPADIYEKDNVYYMDLELPGVKKEDIHIELSDNILKVSGEYKKDKNVKEENYYCCERREGTFSRTFTIPKGIEKNNIKAKLENGILKITFKKPEKKEIKKKIIIE